MKEIEIDEEQYQNILATLEHININLCSIAKSIQEISKTLIDTQ